MIMRMRIKKLVIIRAIINRLIVYTPGLQELNNQLGLFERVDKYDYDDYDDNDDDYDNDDHDDEARIPKKMVGWG